MEWETVKKVSSKGGPNKAGSNLTVPLEKIPVKVEQESRAHVPPPSASPSHHAASKKKPKPKKLASIEECLAKITPGSVAEVAERVQAKKEENPLNALQEVHSYLEQVFSKAEQEKDYVFSALPPGYPLSALSPKCRAPLLKLVSQTSGLLQEKLFRYCVDRLLVELGSGCNSCGTRILLLLLIECNHSLCLEDTGNMIKRCLESNISKVPEALSLLWVGLPHPRLHPLTVMRTWPDLCCPLLQRSNVPRQVFSYAVDYTCLLIRFCTELEEGNDGILLEILSPTTLSSFLASPQLMHYSSQKNVQLMLESAQAAVLETASDSKLSGYFRATFKLASPENNLSAVQFAARCLHRSADCWEAWSGLAPYSPAFSGLLLKRLSLAQPAPPPPPVPFGKLANILAKVTRKSTEKERELAKHLLEAYANSDIGDVGTRGVHRTDDVELEREEKGAGWGCGFVIVVLSLVYICFLSLLLYHIATQGPDAILEKIGDVVGTRDVSAAWRLTALTLSRYSSAVLAYVPQIVEYVPQMMEYMSQLPQQLLAMMNSNGTSSN